MAELFAAVLVDILAECENAWFFYDEIHFAVPSFVSYDAKNPPAYRKALKKLCRNLGRELEVLPGGWYKGRRLEEEGAAVSSEASSEAEE